MKSFERLILGVAGVACVLTLAAWFDTRALIRNLRQDLDGYTVPSVVEEQVRRTLSVVEGVEPASAFDAAKIKATREQVAAPVNALRPTQRQLLSPELERINWALNVRELVTSEVDLTPAGLLARRELANRSEAEKPDQAPEHLVKLLSGSQALLREQAMDFIRIRIAAEKEKLTTGIASLLASPAAIPEDTTNGIAEAEFVALGWKDDPAADHAAIDELPLWAKSRDVFKFAGAVFKEQAVRTEPAKLAEKLEANAACVQEIEAVRDELEPISKLLPKLKVLLDERAKALGEQQQKLAREVRNYYQLWALELVKKFDAEWSRGAKNVATVSTHLFPIDETFLERPVANLLQSRLQGAWDELASKNWELATKSVEVAKITPEDLLKISK